MMPKTVLGYAGVAEIAGDAVHVQVVGESDRGRLVVQEISTMKTHVIERRAFVDDLAVAPEPISDEVRTAAITLTQAVERARAMAGQDGLLGQEDYQVLLGELDETDQYPFASALLEHGVSVRTGRRAAVDVLTDPHEGDDPSAKSPEPWQGPGGAGEAQGAGADTDDQPGLYPWDAVDRMPSNEHGTTEHDYPAVREIEGQAELRSGEAQCGSCGHRDYAKNFDEREDGADGLQCPQCRATDIKLAQDWRDQGRYDYSSMDATCVCGHRLGDHSAEPPRDCFYGQMGEPGPACTCEKFRKSRKRSHVEPDADALVARQGSYGSGTETVVVFTTVGNKSKRHLATCPMVERLRNRGMRGRFVILTEQEAVDEALEERGYPISNCACVKGMALPLWDPIEWDEETEASLAPQEKDAEFGWSGTELVDERWAQVSMQDLIDSPRGRPEDPVEEGAKDAVEDLPGAPKVSRRRAQQPGIPREEFERRQQDMWEDEGGQQRLDLDPRPAPEEKEAQQGNCTCPEPTVTIEHPTPCRVCGGNVPEDWGDLDVEADLASPSGRDRGLNPSVHEQINEAYTDVNQSEDPDLHLGRRSVLDAVDAAVLSAYRAGLSMAKIAEQHGVSERTVSNFLRGHGVQARTLADSHRVRSLDESVFDTVTPESAYWVGFLMADGAVTTHRQGAPQIRVNLSETDREHLLKFRSFLKSSHTVSRIVLNDHRPGWENSQPQASLSVASARLSEALARFGVVPRKSKTAEVRGGLEHNRDFWRGVVDGDGSVGFSGGRPVLQLAGSRPLMEQFLSYVQTVAETKAQVRPSGPIWAIGVTGKAAVQVIQALYEGSRVSLDRKRVKAEGILGLPNDNAKLTGRAYHCTKCGALFVRHGDEKFATIRNGSGHEETCPEHAKFLLLNPEWRTADKPGSPAIPAPYGPDIPLSDDLTMFDDLDADEGSVVQHHASGDGDAGIAGDKFEPEPTGDGVDSNEDPEDKEPFEFGVLAVRDLLAQGVDNRQSDPNVQTNVDEQQDDRAIDRPPAQEDLRYSVRRLIGSACQHGVDENYELVTSPAYNQMFGEPPGGDEIVMRCRICGAERRIDSKTHRVRDIPGDQQRSAESIQQRYAQLREAALDAYEMLRELHRRDWRRVPLRPIDILRAALDDTSESEKRSLSAGISETVARKKK